MGRSTCRVHPCTHTHTHTHRNTHARTHKHAGARAHMYTRPHSDHQLNADPSPLAMDSWLRPGLSCCRTHSLKQTDAVVTRAQTRLGERAGLTTPILWHRSNDTCTSHPPQVLLRAPPPAAAQLSRSAMPPSSAARPSSPYPSSLGWRPLRPESRKAVHSSRPPSRRA